MRMHSDKLTRDDLHRIADETLPADVHLDAREHGSRKRSRAFEVHMNAERGHDRFGNHRRPSNSGSYGANSYSMAATWHEWGDFIAGIFREDPRAIFGPYTDGAKFLEDTAKFDPMQRETPQSERVSPWAEQIEPTVRA